MTAPTWIGCAPNNFKFGRRRHITGAGIKQYQEFEPEAIVIHISTGSAKSADNTFGNGSSHVSAHYLVTKNGDIHQYVKPEDTAYHCGVVDEPAWETLNAPGKLGVNPNLFTIGIEHEGQPDDEWPDAQYLSSAELLASLSVQFNIPLDRSHIVPHHWIRANKRCPGEKVDLDRLVTMAKGFLNALGEPANQNSRVDRDS